MKKYYILILIALVVSCQKEDIKQTHTIETLEKPESVAPEPNPISMVSLKVFSYEDVARYALSVIMNQAPKRIKVRKNGELYYATYVRKSDNQRFDYKIMFEGERVVWASIDGRWRNDYNDETIKFSEENGKLAIIQVFEDGSQSKDVFYKGD